MHWRCTIKLPDSEEFKIVAIKADTGEEAVDLLKKNAKDADVACIRLG